MICVLNSMTSILAGFAVFSILGNIAHNQGKEVSDVVTEGMCTSRPFFCVSKFSEIKLIDE